MAHYSASYIIIYNSKDYHYSHTYRCNSHHIEVRNKTLCFIDYLFVFFFITLTASVLSEIVPFDVRNLYNMSLLVQSQQPQVKK